MQAKYYVQEIANNYVKNVIDNSELTQIHPAYWHGCKLEPFKEGLLALTALTKKLYMDITANPDAFGMVLKENTIPDAKNADYTNSHANFIRVPNLLFVIGAIGTLGSDGALICEGGVLSSTAKEMKITGLTFLLNKLGDYDLRVEGVNKTIKPGERIVISCPNNPALTVALKSMVEAELTLTKGKMKTSHPFFYMMHGGLLAQEKVKAPKLTIDDILRTLSPEQRAAATALHEYAAGEAKQTVKMGGFMRNDWSCVYTANRTNRVLMTLHVNQDRLSVKLNLQNIGRYINQLQELPDALTSAIRSGGWECGRCHESCGGGFAFELEGQAYNKCRCGSFVFDDIQPAEIPYFTMLLTKELAS